MAARERVMGIDAERMAEIGGNMTWQEMKRSLWERELEQIIGRMDSVLVYAPSDEDRDAMWLAGKTLRDRLNAYNQLKEETDGKMS